LKRISLELAQHKIELDITIPFAHQVRYKLNQNYVTIVKQKIDMLLTTKFIQYMEDGTWLSPIVVVPKENGKLRICIDFKKLNVATNKDPYPLSFTNEVLNIIIGYEAY